MYDILSELQASGALGVYSKCDRSLKSTEQASTLVVRSSPWVNLESRRTRLRHSSPLNGTIHISQPPPPHRQPGSRASSVDRGPFCRPPFGRSSLDRDDRTSLRPAFPPRRTYRSPGRSGNPAEHPAQLPPPPPPPPRLRGLSKGSGDRGARSDRERRRETNAGAGGRRERSPGHRERGPAGDASSGEDEGLRGARGGERKGIATAREGNGEGRQAANAAIGGEGMEGAREGGGGHLGDRVGVAEMGGEKGQRTGRGDEGAEGSAREGGERKKTKGGAATLGKGGCRADGEMGTDDAEHTVSIMTRKSASWVPRVDPHEPILGDSSTASIPLRVFFLQALVTARPASDSTAIRGDLPASGTPPFARDTPAGVSGAPRRADRGEGPPGTPKWGSLGMSPGHMCSGGQRITEGGTATHLPTWGSGLRQESQTPASEPGEPEGLAGSAEVEVEPGVALNAAVGPRTGAEKGQESGLRATVDSKPLSGRAPGGAMSCAAIGSMTPRDAVRLSPTRPAGSERVGGGDKREQEGRRETGRTGDGEDPGDRGHRGDGDREEWEAEELDWGVDSEEIAADVGGQEEEEGGQEGGTCRKAEVVMAEIESVDVEMSRVQGELQSLKAQEGRLHALARDLESDRMELVRRETCYTPVHADTRVGTRVRGLRSEPTQR